MTLGAFRGLRLRTPASTPVETGVLFSPKTRGLDLIAAADSRRVDLAGDLAVLVSTENESAWRSAAAERSAGSGWRWVDLVLGGDRVRLGPLSRLDWPVCTRCAEARIEAARGTVADASTATDLARLARVAAALLTREIEALAADTSGAGLLTEHLLSLDAGVRTLTLHKVLGPCGG